MRTQSSHVSNRMPLSMRAKTAVAVGCTLAVIGVGGTLAYLTDTDTATNRFSVSSALDIELLEPSWQTTDEDANGIPDAAEQVVPLQSVAKDPQIRNTAGTEAWAFLEVAVPTENVRVVEEDGSLSVAENHPLFTYETNIGWSEIESTSYYDPETKTTKRFYVWSEPLGVGETTGSLFDEVTLINLANGQLGGTEGKAIGTQIDVTAHAIQTDGFANWKDAWSALTTQSA